MVIDSDWDKEPVLLARITNSSRVNLMRMESSTTEENLTSMLTSSLGKCRARLTLLSRIQSFRRCSASLNSSREISRPPSVTCELHQTDHLSPLVSGKTSSEACLWTSRRSTQVHQQDDSQACQKTALHKLKMRLDGLKESYRTLGAGLLRGMQHARPSSLCQNNALTSSMHIQTTSWTSSPCTRDENMLSSSTIELCRKSKQPRTHGPSRTSLSSNISNMQSFQGHANLKQDHSKQIDLRNEVKGMKSATTIMPESATGKSLPVIEDMSALPASSQAMSQEARSAKRLEEAIHRAE